jgi:dihydrodipicolinate synthase/N-acetylneuraminate lyase
MQMPGLIVAPLTLFTSDLKVDDGASARSIAWSRTAAITVVAAGVDPRNTPI